jgi:hypothetical protein
MTENRLSNDCDTASDGGGQGEGVKGRRKQFSNSHPQVFSDGMMREQRIV